MGAVALSQADEAVLESLQERLRLPSKSQVIHRALAELQSTVERNRLAHEIKESILKCREADQAEHEFLTGAARYRLTKE